jgi:hypothetical protein
VAACRCYKVQLMNFFLHASSVEAVLNFKIEVDLSQLNVQIHYLQIDANYCDFIKVLFTALTI